MGLKDISFPFNPDSEEEVRSALAMYFADLGFTLNEMSFEDSYQLRIGHSMIVVGGDQRQRTVRAYSDMLLVRNGQPLAIVETKDPDVDLSDADSDQGLSYARLLHTMAPFTIVTNGRELVVYDTITAEKIASGTPADATWVRNGKRFVGVDDETRNWAIRTLFSLNFGALQSYCRVQSERGMADLRSAPGDRRRYDPELYIPRQSLREAFRAFMASNTLCLAVVGESGIGKSNELCALAEMINHGDADLVLFYRAGHLWRGLTDAIANDFVWEFQQDEPAARIIQRFSEVVRSHQAKLYLFIDGLDESPGEHRNFRAELNDLVIHLDPALVRLCVSCKTYDWPFFVRDRGNNLNSFGRCVFPHLNDVDLPGVTLQPFSENELDEAWPKYSEVFRIDSALRGETREECRAPLMLRLVAETFEQVDSGVPDDLSDVAIFDRYWSHKFSDFDHPDQMIAEDIISKAADRMVTMDQAELDERDFCRLLDPAVVGSPAYTNVVRFGLLSRRVRLDGHADLTFPFGKLRSFVYTVKARDWSRISDRSRQSEEVQRALATRLGRDALLFYLDTVAEELEGWLAPLIDFDLPLFVRTVRALTESNQHRRRPRTGVDEQSVEVRMTSLTRFISTYARLRDQFPNLKTRLLPCTSGEAGLWMTNVYHGYRTLTPEYPQPLVQLPDEMVGLLGRSDLDATVRRELRPTGGISNVLWSKLSRDLPEAVALEEVNEQIAKLVGAWLLDETGCSLLPMERIHRILKDRPLVWQSDLHRYNWEFLGYESLEAVQTANCSDIIQRVDQLVRTWSAAYRASEDPRRRWYELQIEKMLVLRWYLAQLRGSIDRLSPPMFTSQELFSYLRDRNLDPVAEIVARAAPRVMENYSRLVERNFGALTSLFTMYRHQGARLVVEISEASTEFMRNDFLLLTYVLLPFAPAGPPIVRVKARPDSIAERFVLNIRSLGSLFAEDVSVTTEVDGRIITEPHAIVSRTQYPDNCVISSQVYQLIRNEAQDIFAARWGWAGTGMTTEIDRNKVILNLLTGDMARVTLRG